MIDKKSGDILQEKISSKLKSFEEEQEKIEDKYTRKCAKCISHLVEEECITSKVANEVLSEKTGIPSINLYTTKNIPEDQIEGEILDLFNKIYLLKHHCFPLRVEKEGEESVIEVAIADPDDKDSLLEIETAITNIFSCNLLGKIVNVKPRFFVCHISAIRNRLALAKM